MAGQGEAVQLMLSVLLEISLPLWARVSPSDQLLSYRSLSTVHLLCEFQ